MAAIKQDAEEMLEGTADLSDKERLFVAYYLQDLDAPGAAKRAGYCADPESVRQYSYQLLKKPKIRKAIDLHMLNVFMETAEMKMRLSDHARGSFDDLMEIDVDGNIKFDWNKARKNGAIRLVKKIKMKERIINLGEDQEPIREVTTDVELHDAQSALINIGKLHNLFKETVEIKTETGDTPFDVMAKAFQAGIEKGEKIKKCRQSSK